MVPPVPTELAMDATEYPAVYLGGHHRCLAVSPFLGKARGVNPDRKSGAGVPKAVIPTTPATLLVPKLYRHLSFPWIRQLRGEGGLAARTTAGILYILPRLCSSTGEDTPATLKSAGTTREMCRYRL